MLACGMASPPTSLRLGKQGRIVVPASLRYELGLEAGDELVVRVEGGKLVLEPRQSVIERLRARFRVAGGGLADELLAERREEAQRE